jgi:hypothetical protein
MTDIVERLRLDAEPTESDMEEAATEIERLRVERDRLREALQTVLDACDTGYMIERDTGGITVGAQMRRSFYDGVPAWLIEEARAALGEDRA